MILLTSREGSPEDEGKQHSSCRNDEELAAPNFVYQEGGSDSHDEVVDREAAVDCGLFNGRCNADTI